jgi:hypothetical protein
LPRPAYKYKGYFTPKVAQKAEKSAFPVVIPWKSEAHIVCAATEDVCVDVCVSVLKRANV